MSRVLMWHVHGSWTTSAVAGPHTYLIPVDAERGPDGRGRARTYPWGPQAVEVPHEDLASTPVDIVVLQRPHEIELAHRLTGWRPGIDVPALYIEHNAPRGDVPDTRHPLAERSDITVVHVTRSNALLWDTGQAPTAVLDHGVARPAPTWAREVARAGVVVNEPVRRGRVAGTDLLPAVAAAVGLDVFGIGVSQLAALLPAGPDGRPAGLFDDPPQHEMHAELARRAVYVHPFRWTSLGLALLEAMAMGMPVVAIAMLGAVEAIEPGCGVLARSPAELLDATAALVADPARAAALGDAAAAHVAQHYSMTAFLAGVDHLLATATQGVRE